MGANFSSSGQTEMSGSGTIVALNGAVTASVPTSSTFAFTITGTWSATLIFEATVDGTNWFTVHFLTPTTAPATTTTSNVSGFFPIGGYFQVRVRASAFVSGTATVAWNADSNQNSVRAYSTLASSFLTSSQITDGTDTVLVTTNGDQKVADGVRNGGVYGALSIPTANTPVEAKVGASRLSNRKLLQIYSNNNGLFWGLDNSVTTSSGTPLVNGQVITFSIDPDSTFQIWLVGSSNSKSVQVVEAP